MDLSSQVEQLEKRLKILDDQQAKYARNRAIERGSKRLAALVSREAAKAERLKVGLVKKKIKVVNLRKQGVAVIKIGRTAIPAIHVGVARSQVKRKKGKALVSKSRRDSRGRFIRREHAGNTAIKVGRHTFPNAFLQRLSSGRWHILHRTSDSRYPIDLAKIPIEKSITAATNKHSKQVIEEYLPQILIKDMNYRIDKLKRKR